MIITVLGGAGFMGGVEAFTASMCEGMRLTLERIRAEAES